MNGRCCKKHLLSTFFCTITYNIMVYNGNRIAKLCIQTLGNSYQSPNCFIKYYKISSNIIKIVDNNGWVWYN